MSFPKRIMYGTKELWNKILEEINGIKTWCDNRFVSKDSTSTTTYPVIETGSAVSVTTTVQDSKPSLSISGTFTYAYSSRPQIIYLSPTLVIVFGITNGINPTNNSEYEEAIYLTGRKALKIKNVLGVTLTPALSESATNSNLLQGCMQFISLKSGPSNDMMYLRFVYDFIATNRTSVSTFRVNYICFVETYEN